MHESILPAPPEFLVEPEDIAARVGSQVMLECLAVGRPPPTVVWSVLSQGGYNDDVDAAFNQSYLLLPQHHLDDDPTKNIWVNVEGTLIIKKVSVHFIPRKINNT